MLEALREHLKDSRLIPDGDRVLVGYSGGADSTALVHLLRELGIDFVAAHLHHGLRQEADVELKLCEAFCQSLGVQFVSGRADLPRMMRDRKLGVEEAGRLARYAFFRQAAAQLGCRWIATGHTKDDHVETVLLHLARGSGIGGLAGLPSRRDDLIRPLLPFGRAETRAYCEEHGFWFHDDPANSDVSLSRSRLRHRVLPELRHVNPAADDAIARLAHLAGEEDAFLNGAAAAALEQAEIPLNGKLRFLTLDCEAAFDRSKLELLPKVLFRRAVRLAAHALGAELNWRQTEALVDLMEASETGAVTADEGLVVVEVGEQAIHFREAAPDEPFRFPLTYPGETVSEAFGWLLTAFPSKASAKPERDALEVQISPPKGSMYFRSAAPGDKMQPLGFGHHRKLSDLLAEAGLTVSARKRLPIVCDLVGPIWAPGVCLDDRVAPREPGSEAVTLRISAEVGPLSP